MFSFKRFRNTVRMESQLFLTNLEKPPIEVVVENNRTSPLPQKSPDFHDSKCASAVQVSKYFEICFNFLYHLFFMPFRISRRCDKSFAIQRSLFRMVFCGFLHPIVCLNSILEIRGVATGKVREHPEIFFRIAERFTSALFVVMFVRTVWFRQNTILAIFEELQSEISTKKFNARRSVLLFWCFLLPFSVFSFISKFLSEDFTQPNFQDKFEKFTQIVRYEISFGESKSYSGEILADTHCQYLKILSAMLLATRLYKWVLIDCISGVCLIASLASLLLAKEFKHYVEEAELLSNELNDERVLNFYSKMKNNFNKINKVLGPFFTICFLSLITFFAVGIVEILDADSRVLQFRLIIYNMMYFFLFIFAAEAHHLASYMKSWLLNRPNHTLRHIATCLDSDNGNVGLTGGRFFSITYGFLGTAGSIILTYAVFTMQLGAKPPNPY